MPRTPTSTRSLEAKTNIALGQARTGPGVLELSVDTRGVDWDKLLQAKKRKTRKVLFGIGAYGRRVADSLIKKEGKAGGKAHISKPGKPPKWHVRPGLKDNFLFDVNQKEQKVVVGPRSFKSSRIIPHAASGAELLEFGGVFTVKKGGKRFRMRRRPFMQPTFKKMLPQFNKLLTKTPLK